MDDLIKELSKIYSTTKFKKSYRDGNEVLLYDNEELEWDEAFIDKVIELAQVYLIGSELDGFTFLFDYLNEIAICDTNKVYGVDYFRKEEKGFFQKKFTLGSRTVSIKMEHRNEDWCRDLFKNIIFLNAKNNDSGLFITEANF